MITIYAVFLCLAEWICRYLAEQTIEERITNVKEIGDLYILDDSKPIYYMNPDLVFYAPGSRKEVVGRLNAQGFRGDDFSLEKKPGTYRIACLGDSFTFGHGVRQEETFPSQLEKILNAETRDGIFEVFNFGVGGYNTEQEAILLEEKVLSYDPDLVILQYLLNDIEVSRIRLPGTRYAVPASAEIIYFEEEPIPISIPLPGRLNHILLRYSYFYRWITKRVYFVRMNYFSHFECNVFQSGYYQCAESIERIKELCDRFGIRLLFLIFAPATSDFPIQDKDHNHQWIRMVINDIGLDTIDFFDVFRDYNIRELVNILEGVPDRGGHYNGMGHRIVAENVAKWVLDESKTINTRRLRGS